MPRVKLHRRGAILEKYCSVGTSLHSGNRLRRLDRPGPTPAAGRPAEQAHLRPGRRPVRGPTGGVPARLLAKASCTDRGEGTIMAGGHGRICPWPIATCTAGNRWCSRRHGATGSVRLNAGAGTVTGRLSMQNDRVLTINGRKASRKWLLLMDVNKTELFRDSLDCGVSLFYGNKA